MLPQQFGKYLLLEKIAVGGMAEVFKAKIIGVEGFEKLIAIKRILPNISEDQEFITMFTDEAKIAGELSHANIAQIFDLGRVGNIYFIAMEYIHGKDLRTIWERHRKRGLKMPVPMSVYIMSRVCEGLDYAHRKKNAAGRDLNIIHRDVSPQNILVSYEGEVKIIDFGIAKAANKASKTQAGILKGKFGYMSPEQVRGLPLDRRSDIFSAGIVLYELVCGERLFAGSSDFSTLEKIRKVEILPPSTINQNISPELERIILKALAKDPADRYQWAYEMQEDLQAYLIKSGQNYTRKDLSNYLKKAFRRDIEQELERHKQFESVKVETMVTPVEPSVTEVQTKPKSRPQVVVPVEDSEDEDIETVIWDPRAAQKESQPKKPTIPATPSRIAPRPPPLKRVTPRPSVDLPPPLAAKELEDETLKQVRVPPKKQLFDDETPEDKAPEANAPFADETPEQSRLAKWSDSEVPERKLFRRPLVVLMSLVIIGGCLAVVFYLRKQGLLGGEAEIDFEVTPSEAVVYFDGRPASHRLSGIKPGEHTLEITAPNYQPFRETIKLKPGEKKRFPVSLQFIAGTLVLEYAPADAQVKLDGKNIEGTSPLRLQLAPGREYELEVFHPAYTKESFKVSVEPRKETHRKIALNEKTYQLEISSEPNGARVLLDGKFVGKTPLKLEKIGAASSHQLQVEKPGYVSWNSTLVYNGDDNQQLSIKLEKEENPTKEKNRPAANPAPKSGKGILAINSVPWGEVLINGKSTGRHTPLPSLEIEAGTYVVTIKFPDGIEKSQRVKVTAGQKEKVIIKEKEDE